MCLLSPASPVGTLGQIGLSLIIEAVIEMTLITKQQSWVSVCLLQVNKLSYFLLFIARKPNPPPGIMSECQGYFPMSILVRSPNRGTTQCSAETKTSVLAGASSAPVSGIICLQTQSGLTWFWLYAFRDGFLLRWTQCSLAKRNHRCLSPQGVFLSPAARPIWDLFTLQVPNGRWQDCALVRD